MGHRSNHDLFFKLGTIKKKILWSCSFLITLFTVINETFMLHFYMAFKLIFPLVTVLKSTFMLCCYMLFNMSFCFFFIITLVTVINNTFMMHFIVKLVFAGPIRPMGANRTSNLLLISNTELPNIKMAVKTSVNVTRTSKVA